MLNGPCKILVKMDEPHDSDPDPSNSCMFLENGKYYRVYPTTPNPETKELERVWTVREAVKRVVMSRKCETIFVPR